MKNIDKIRGMSAEELAENLEKKACYWCINYNLNHDKCRLGLIRPPECCRHGIVEWLNQEVNPMPELFVGDVIETVNNRYVVIWGNTVIGVKEICSTTIPAYICPTYDVLAHETVKVIWRHNSKEKMFEKIWRADDGNQ